MDVRSSPIDRRRFLQGAAATLGLALIGPAGLHRALAVAVPGPGPYGPLGPADANGIRLPSGFTSRVLATSEEPVGATGFPWHHAPDGGAVFDDGDGWTYVSNSEVPLFGGASAIRFGPDGEVRGAGRILAGTSLNCAGGATPWGTWLSCEEHEAGLVWECDPAGTSAAIPRPALGVFKHEAACVDPVGGHVYLSEDQADGLLYRFTPATTTAGRMDLGSGVLEAAAVGAGGAVTWLAVPDPTLAASGTQTRHQVPGATAFRGGEGLAWADGSLYLTTKGDHRVWVLDLATSAISVLWDGRATPSPLRGVDNVVVSSAGDVYVAEDGDDMQLCVLTPEGECAPVLQIEGHDGSEITGPAFSPCGDRLYLSSQRGKPSPASSLPSPDRRSEGVRRGITYEIRGPFRT